MFTAQFNETCKETPSDNLYKWKPSSYEYIFTVTSFTIHLHYTCNNPILLVMLLVIPDHLIISSTMFYEFLLTKSLTLYTKQSFFLIFYAQLIEQALNLIKINLKSETVKFSISSNFSTKYLIC